MYFFKKFDGESLNVQQIIRDVKNSTNYIVATPLQPTVVKTATGDTLCKYEIYINEYKDTGTATNFISGVGSIFYAGSINGTDVSMLSLVGVATLGTLNNAFDLDIINNSKGSLRVINVMIEEIS
jgi:hypothetical protein